MATTTKTKAQTRKTRAPKGILNKEAQKEKPTEEQIRQKAEEIYNERLVRSEYGTALDDWQKAEQLLSQS